MFCEDGICTRIVDEPPVNMCKDSNTGCKQFAADGECEFNPTWMHPTCPNSCKLCPSFACADENPHCQYWASQGECDNNPAYMHEFCLVSCGICENSQANYDKTYGPKPNCTDSLEECSRYVSKGMCSSSHIFMMNNCPAACDMCGALEDFNKCIGKRHPLEKPIFKKEGQVADAIVTMDLFFEGLKLKQNTIVITQPSTDSGKDAAAQTTDDPYILQINNFLSGEKCDNLIEIAANIGWMESTVNKLDNFSASQSSTLPSRSSKSVKCEISHAECQKAISEIIATLSLKTGIPATHFETGEIVHYPQGGYYSSHYNPRLSDEYKPAGPRVLTMNIILSEATNGGSFGFPELDWLLINPNSRGSLLLWPNVDNTLQVDERMANEIMPVREGDLYLLQMYVHLFDYSASVEKGCP